MKKAAVVLTVLILAASVFAQESIWFGGSYDEAKALAHEREKMILIDFSSDY